jgi:hypothetical protein
MLIPSVVSKLCPGPKKAYGRTRRRLYIDAPPKCFGEHQNSVQGTVYVALRLRPKVDTIQLRNRLYMTRSNKVVNIKLSKNIIFLKCFRSCLQFFMVDKLCHSNAITSEWNDINRNRNSFCPNLKKNMTVQLTELRIVQFKANSWWLC